MVDAVHGRIGIKLCQPCIRKGLRHVANIYCEDCGEYQCKKCENVHQLFPVMSEHKLVTVDKARNLGSKYDMKGLDQCKEHHKLIDFFCEDENMPCCGKCAIVSHRKCRHVVEIEKTKELKNLDLFNSQQDFLEIEVKLKKIVHHLESSKDKFTKDAFKITNKIQTIQDKVNEMFENLKRTISKEIASFQKQVFDDIDTKTAVCDSCMADLKQTVAEIQAVSEQGSPAQQLIMAQNCKVRGSELKRQTEKMSAELKDFVLKFAFDDSLKLPPAEHDFPGKLRTNVIAVPELSSGIMVSPQKEQKVILKLLASIDLKKGKGDVDEPLLLGLDFLPGGRLVTIDNINKSCVVFSRNLKRLNSFALPMIPQGLAVVSDGEVAITTAAGFTIFFINISKLNEITVARECDVKNRYQSISTINNDSMLVGCSDDPQAVRVVSMKGEERDFGIDFPTKKYPLGSSECTYIRNRNKVVFSDRFAHTVFIQDKATNMIVEVKDEKIIKEPRGMSVGPADCIFVCCNLTNSIVQISHTGQILSSHALDMNNPRSVCVSKDNTRLAVSNNANGKMKLQLYNIELMN